MARMATTGGGGGGGGGGGIGGLPPTNYDPRYGGIPTLTNPIDLVLGNMGGITGIQTGLTDNALQLLRNMYGPGYFATLEQLRRNADRRAHGDISDLLPEMWQRNAEAAVGGGYSGSAQENTKRLRDMGLKRNELEDQAVRNMAAIFGMTPTVAPQDMSGIIQAMIQARAMQEIYNSSPRPGDYARNLPSGGGGSLTGGVRYNLGGGGAGKVDDILKRMGGNAFGPPVIAHGTKAPDYYSGPAPYGSIPFYDQPGLGPGEPQDEPPAGPIGWAGVPYAATPGDDSDWRMPGWTPYTYTPPTGFGGSLDYDPGGWSGGFDPFDTSWMDYPSFEPPPLAPPPIDDFGGGYDWNAPYITEPDIMLGPLF